MSKLLTNQISNYNDNGPVEVKDGINVATGKPLQVAGAAGTSGQYLKSTGSSVAWTTFPTTVAGYGITDAFSGAYADLTGKPTIPSNIGDLANVASTAPANNQVLKWNGSSWTPAADSAGIVLSNLSVSVSAVGAANLTYNNTSGEFNFTPPDLSGYLTTLGSVGGHTDVNITNVQNDQVLKYNSTTSKWENKADGGGGGGSTTFAALTDTPANFTSQAGKFLKVNAGASALEFTDAPAGTTTFTGLTDTPANFTSQAGKYLKVNAGATALEYVTLPVDPDTNTTYSQASVADGSNVKLRLTDSSSTNDDILITAGNNITISSVTAGGFTIASTASGGSSTFAGLTDTPANFTGAATKTVVVNSAGNALEFVDSGTSSNEILPVAYAHIQNNNAGTDTNMSHGAYNTSNGDQVFTFDTALSDTDYYVLSEREQYDTHTVSIISKSTTGFTARWLDNSGTGPLSPDMFPGVLIVYASTPTRSVGAGAGALPTASATVLGGIKVGTNLSINGSGVLSATDTNTQLSTEEVQDIVGAMFSGNTETNITATYEDSDGTIDLVASGGSGLQSRTTGAATSTGLADAAAGNLTIVAAKSYILHKIQTSHAAWVTVYTDSTARTNDAARSESTDPLPGTGVIAEVITSDGATQPITPGTIGWNNEGTPTTNAYVKVVNKSGNTADVTVTLHFVAVEA